MDEASIKRTMPNSFEAEKSVIGAMIMDQDTIHIAADILNDSDFYNKRLGIIFSAIVSLYENGKPADFITLTNKLKELKAPDDVTEIEYISNLVSSVPTAANIKHYAQIVADNSSLRKMIKLTDNISEKCYSASADANELMETAEKDIFKLTQSRNTGDEFVPIKEVSMNTLKNIEEASKSQGAVTGIPTGFKHLDTQTAGLQASDLILIAARPAMGKTAFALNLAENIAMKNSYTTAIFSLEMSKVQLAKRLISMNSKVDSQKIRTGQLEPTEWQSITESAIILGKSSIVIDDTPSITLQHLSSKCRKLKLEKGLDLIIIDYLQLMESGSSNKNLSRQQAVADISRGLKGLARELNCPIIALSQLSRKVEEREDKRPMLSDLRESGAIEQDADMVIFLYRDEYYNKDSSTQKGITEVIISKQRSGPTGTVKLKWIAELTKFGNLEYTHHEQ